MAVANRPRFDGSDEGGLGLGVVVGVLVVELWATTGRLIASVIDKNPAVR